VCVFAVVGVVMCVFTRSWRLSYTWQAIVERISPKKITP
jgi:hypothetical protein